MSSLTGILILGAIIVVFLLVFRRIMPPAVSASDLQHEDETDEP